MLTGYLESYAFWLLLGLALLLSEFFFPGLIAVFFGLGALLVGALTLVGLVEGLAWQVLLFSLFSVGTLWLLRRRFQRWLRGGESDLALRLIGRPDLAVRLVALFLAAPFVVFHESESAPLQAPMQRLQL